MGKYSRYGSYFLAIEKNNSDKNNIKVKPINRKRFDFVKDTDPENFADNISDDNLSDDELVPEGFPVGDISDELDDPSDNINPFPDDTEDIDDIEDFPEDNSMDDFPEDNSMDNFPEEPEETENDVGDFPDGGEDVNATDMDNASNTSSDAIHDGHGLLDDIINNKIGKDLPTPDEIINDLKNQVYGENPPDATQTNDNDTGNTDDMSNFPTDTGTDDNTGIDSFPDENNQTGGDINNNQPDENTPPGFPSENIAVDNTTGGDTDFTNGADGMMNGGDQMGGTQPQQPVGPGVGYDSMRKYNLYKEYNKLLTAITNYITRLENIIFDEPHQNLIVKTCVEKLNEIKKLCYDYITMKFELASYTQAYVFFEELAVGIQVVFNILLTISSYTDINKNDSKTTRKSRKNKSEK